MIAPWAALAATRAAPARPGVAAMGAGLQALASCTTGQSAIVDNDAIGGSGGRAATEPSETDSEGRRGGR